jgi:very-short-patch-repair endonuclease
MKARKPKALSPGEEAFSLHCRVENLNPVREFRFCNRMWRFDFAFPDKKVAVEIEGGIWTGGRHTRGSGFVHDLDKYNTAARMGWSVLRYAPQMVESGQAINEVLEVLREATA